MTKNQTPANTPTSDDTARDIKRVVGIGAAVFIGLIIGIFAIALVLALLTDLEKSSRIIQLIRDIVLIVMTLTGITIVVELAVLIFQIARLVNLTRSEVSPILRNTQETASNVKGTVNFVSDHVVEPTIKTAGFLAGVSRIIRDVGGIRRAIRRDGQSENENE